MNFRALGPINVSVAGARIAVGGPRHQVVLALLLAAAGRVVSVDALADALWGSRQPVTARAQVHTCVSRLRRQLLPRSDGTEIATEAPGYTLRLAPDDTYDVGIFGALVEQGRVAAHHGDPTAAMWCLRDALALWRGEPFGAVGRGSALLDDVAAGLWEQRSAAIGLLVECAFGLGRHADVINELRAEVERDPLAEQPSAQLIMALYGAGRRVEALRQYQDVRRLFVEELGMEPGPRLRELEKLIMTGASGALDGAEPPGDPRPEVVRGALAEVAPHHLPPPVADFVGREAEVVAIIGRLAGGAPGSAVAPAPVAMVVGSAGVGKSTLAVHAAWRLSAEFPDGQLYAQMRGTAQRAGHRRWAPAADLTDDAASAGRDGALAGLLKRFLGALGAPADAVPDDTEERLTLYRQLLSGRRVLIVLDDVASEDQIAPLLPGSDTCAVLATSRRRLASIPGALNVELAPFRPSDSVRLLADVLGDERVSSDPTGAARLARACGNLPLAVRIVAARLAARPHWSLRRMADRLTADSALDELHYGDLVVRDSVLLTYEQLDPSARRLFRMLGLFDAPEVGEWVAEPLLGDAHSTRPEDALAVLVEMHLLHVTVVDGIARYTLHDLVRATARERMTVDDAAAERFAAMERVFRALLTLLDVADSGIRADGVPAAGGTALRHPVPHRHRAEVAEHPAAWVLHETPFIVAAVAQSAAMELADLSWELAVRAAAGFAVNRSIDAWSETHTAARLAVEKHGDRAGMAAIDRSLTALAALSEDLAAAEARRSAVAITLAELPRR